MDTGGTARHHRPRRHGPAVGDTRGDSRPTCAGCGRTRRCGSGWATRRGGRSSASSTPRRSSPRRDACTGIWQRRLKMKVALVARSVFPLHGYGGLERHVYDLARALGAARRRGHADHAPADGGPGVVARSRSTRRSARSSCPTAHSRGPGGAGRPCWIAARRIRSSGCARGGARSTSSARARPTSSTGSARACSAMRGPAFARA